MLLSIRLGIHTETDGGFTQMEVLVPTLAACTKQNAICCRESAFSKCVCVCVCVCMCVWRIWVGVCVCVCVCELGDTLLLRTRLRIHTETEGSFTQMEVPTLAADHNCKQGEI